MSTATLERANVSNKQQPKRKTLRESLVAAKKQTRHLDVDGLEKLSREGLEKAIQDGTTPGWTRVI
ncbi:hypothetical protein DN730_09920 [Marinomonas piezotolerans]|uniref:Uncharacterized protein n=1 Tax=Marinomonas piezotolerans TaxID=2213058 RepID=A0A370UA80_9GAMM|nr:hypothetical protein [Marinomonas piezotolerans]RDL44692.1 hypothetical protein DN730_09920 [Marinomonas piezotolerans]